MEAFLLQLAHLNHWQIDLVVTLLLLEGAVFAVFPEEVIMLSLGVLIAQHRVGFLEAILAVQLGLLPANASLFCIGRTFGRGILGFGPIRFLFGMDALARARLAFRRRGAVIVAATRFIPLVRGPVYLAAGLSKIPFRRFFAYDALASCFQIPLLLYAGVALGHSSANILVAYRKIGTAFVLFLGCVLVTKLATAASRRLDARSEF